jgi:hypothetical protein
MAWRSSLWVFLPLWAAILSSSGCCTTARCLDSKSGPDKLRVKGRRLKLGVVHNDRVSSPRRDRTDWKYIDLPNAGKLTVQLHWDNGRSRLRLGIFDVLGVKIQQGRAWGADGRRAVVAIEKPGRYYVRVQALGKRDQSHYSIRTMFKADKTGSVVCHQCPAGERKCLGGNGYIVCEQVNPKCTAWTKTKACPGGAPCKNGQCGNCPAGTCQVGGRRCTARKRYQICVSHASGCPVWGKDRRCRSGTRCRDGYCSRRGKVVKTVRRKPTSQKPKCVKGRIISMYMFRGRRTLHIEVGANHKIRPGDVGVVLRHGTMKFLPGGRIKVLRVSGRYVIATTGINNIGKNRWVCITPSGQSTP